MSDPILEIKNLSVSFLNPDIGHEGLVRAVDGIDLRISRHSFTALVGESGSGKSVTALSITRLVRAHQVSGTIEYRWENGKTLDLLKASETELLKVRGGEVAYIFQDPASSLNPVLRIGEQLTECCRTHFDVTAGQAKTEALDHLMAAKLKDPERVYRSFPHELSGGMKQRVMIAMALISRPKILIADEPTTALDVTMGWEIMALLNDLRRQKKLTILFITHNLALAASHADEIYVMQKGRVIERMVKGLSGFEAKEAYTKRLFNAQISGLEPKTLIGV